MAETEVFDFVGSSGAMLSGRLHRPEGAARGSILLAHCFTCSKDLHTMTRLSNGLAEAGYAALRFDFTGLGESGGDFAETTVSANIVDLTRAAATLIQAGFGPCGLIGHSLGGAASILATQRLKTVESLVTLAAPSSTTHVRHLFEDSLTELADKGRAAVTIAGRTFELEQSFVDDLDAHDPVIAAADLQRPHLIIHAEDDDIVPFSHGQALYAADPDSKTLLALPAGGHLFAARPVAETVLEAIVEFLDGSVKNQASPA